MASPVIINSSSPTSLRLPSITPPSRRDSGKKATSSPEGLPSPSIFVQSKATGLKSGSRAQAVPAQAGFGFATAGSLWRENKLQQDALQFQSREEASGLVVSERKANTKESGARGDAQKQPAGRLKKPRKTARTEERTATEDTGSVTLDFKDSACDDAAVPQPTRRLDMPSPTKPVIEAAPPRKNSVNLSEYGFGVYDLGMQTQAPAAAAPANKARKRAPASEKPKRNGNARPRPRRQKAKSEAVILNSDDAAPDDLKALERCKTAKDVSASMEKKGKKRQSYKPVIATDGENREVDKMSRAREKQCLKTANENASEKSAYFAAFQASDIQVPGKFQDCLQGHEGHVKAQEKASKDRDIGFAESALPRRTSWTPVEDTGLSHHDLAVSATGSPSHAGSPKVRLHDILGGFGYTDAGVKKAAVQRSVTGEPVTKRRRIELADGAVAGPSIRRAEASPEKSEPKQTKPAGRKKLQTITALATAAYQPALEPSIEQSTVSEFFAPRKETGNEAKEVDKTGKRQTKPRKPRKKKAAVEQDCEAAAAAPKKSKPKKAKVKFNEADHRPKLYTPARASVQIKQQDFLFGTSSQLAIDESASFIRDLQAAVEASEKVSSGARNEVYGSHAESVALQSQLAITPRKGKSCLKIPTAPHGTCLSVGQAHRDLWCVSSRDDDGGFLRELFKNDAASGLHHVDGQSEKGNAIVGQHPSHADEAGAHGTLAVATNEPAVDSWAAPDVLSEESQTLDMDLLETRGGAEVTGSTVDATIATAVACADDSTMEPHESDLIGADGTVQQEASVAANDRDSFEDSWMLLSSEGPYSNGLRSPSQAVRSPPPDYACGTSMQSASLVQRMSPSKARSVLQPLDANAGTHVAASHKGILSGQARAFSTSNLDSLPKSPTVKKRDRPRKDANPQSGGVTLPKKRGRPPKRPVIASGPSPEVVKFKKPKATASASQPPQSPSEWLDVDEIYDSDSPQTPSPPRRRASSSPSAVPPLDITVNGSPVPAPKEKASSAVAVTASFKLGEPQWPSVREQLFPEISSTVKDAPRSTDSAQPSWYQKMLMYDPIVLEELTAWLNEQSLRIRVRRQKPKAKKKGRKKRDAEGVVIEQDVETEEELHEEPLQAWMVQKWCEERSICCVWAGGGWGGRARH